MYMEEKRTRKRHGRKRGQQQSQDAGWFFPRVIRFGEKKIVMELLLCLEEGWMLRLGDESVQAQSTDNRRSKKDSALKEDMSYDPSNLFSAIKFFFEGGEMSLYCPSHPQNCFFIVNSWRFLATPPEQDSETLMKAHQMMNERYQIWKTRIWSKEIEKTRGSHPTAPINQLPAEILEAFFSFLPVPTVIQCTLVCYYWHQLITDNQSLWKTLYTSRVGEERAKKKAASIADWKEAYINHAYRGAIEKPRKPREKNKTKKVGSKKQRERNRVSGRAAKQAGF